MMRYTISPTSPKSNGTQMSGWMSRDAASASRRNRSRISGSRARCACITLSTSGRPSVSCSAR